MRWKVGTGCSSSIKWEEQRWPSGPLQGWWWRAAPSAAAHVLPKNKGFIGAESPELALCDLSVLSVQCGRVGGDRSSPGHPMWAWKCAFGGADWSPQSTNWCPQWARLLAHPWSRLSHQTAPWRPVPDNASSPHVFSYPSCTPTQTIRALAAAMLPGAPAQSLCLCQTCFVFTLLTKLQSKIFYLWPGKQNWEEKKKKTRQNNNNNNKNSTYQSC